MTSDKQLNDIIDLGYAKGIIADLAIHIAHLKGRAASDKEEIEAMLDDRIAAAKVGGVSNDKIMLERIANLPDVAKYIGRYSLNEFRAVELLAKDFKIAPTPPPADASLTLEPYCTACNGWLEPTDLPGRWHCVDQDCTLFHNVLTDCPPMPRRVRFVEEDDAIKPAPPPVGVAGYYCDCGDKMRVEPPVKCFCDNKDCDIAHRTNPPLSIGALPPAEGEVTVFTGYRSILMDISDALGLQQVTTKFVKFPELVKALTARVKKLTWMNRTLGDAAEGNIDLAERVHGLEIEVDSVVKISKINLTTIADLREHVEDGGCNCGPELNNLSEQLATAERARDEWRDKYYAEKLDHQQTRDQLTTAQEEGARLVKFAGTTAKILRENPYPIGCARWFVIEEEAKALVRLHGDIPKAADAAMGTVPTVVDSNSTSASFSLGEVTVGEGPTHIPDAGEKVAVFTPGYTQVPFSPVPHPDAGEKVEGGIYTCSECHHFEPGHNDGCSRAGEKVDELKTCNCGCDGNRHSTWCPAFEYRELVEEVEPSVEERIEAVVNKIKTAQINYNKGYKEPLSFAIKVDLIADLAPPVVVTFGYDKKGGPVLNATSIKMALNLLEPELNKMLAAFESKAEQTGGE